MSEEQKPLDEAEVAARAARSARAAARIQEEHHGSPTPVMASGEELVQRDRAARAAKTGATQGEEEKPVHQMSQREMEETTARIRAELARDRAHPLRGLGLGTPSGFAEKERAKDGQSKDEGQSR